MAIIIPTPKLSPEEKQIKQEEKVAEQVKEEQEKQTRLVAEREKQVAEQVKQEQEKEQAKIKQEEADKNLENFMELGSQSGMIKDAKAGVIYVSDNWFLWTVKDKKNFITFGSERLNDATGYGDIKIRHYKSNELLGEFSWGKSQVYK